MHLTRLKRQGSCPQKRSHLGPKLHFARPDWPLGLPRGRDPKAELQRLLLKSILDTPGTIFSSTIASTLVDTSTYRPSRLFIRSGPTRIIIMPRSSRPAGRSAPSRPTVASKPSAPSSQQSRPAATMAAPPQQQMAPPAAAAPSQGPGIFGQMASTAAYVLPGTSTLPRPKYAC